VWFGFPFTLRAGSARALPERMVRRRVANRILLGGNLTLQPGFRGAAAPDRRIAAEPDRIVAAAIWVGCHPALDDAMVEWTAESIADFLKIH
jgi:CDP-4-dehydro-6-deoxyglucose reductase, E1